MASTKISDETTASSLTGTELVPVVQSGSNRKTTVGDIARAGWGYTAVAATSATLADSNRTIDVDTSSVTAPGTVTLTLPTPVAGRIYIIRKVAGAADETITLARAGSERINSAAASFLLPGSNEYLSGGNDDIQAWPTWLVTTNGTDWRVTLISQQVLHTRSADPPIDDEPYGYKPGSTWCETVQDPGSKMHMQMGTDASSCDWMRIDAVDISEIDNGDSPFTIDNRDRHVFVDTTSGAVTIEMFALGDQMNGVQYSITKVNAGTSKITLSWSASTTVNGSSVTTYDLPGSTSADYGRWHVVYASAKVWVTGGSGLV